MSVCIYVYMCACACICIFRFARFLLNAPPRHPQVPIPKATFDRQMHIEGFQAIG